MMRHIPMRHIPCLCVLTSLMSAIAVAPGEAQEALVQPEPATADAARVFGMLGLGVSSEGIGGVLSLSLHRSRTAFIVRTSGATEFEIFFPSDYAEDYALLLGRVLDGSMGWASGAIGPAVVRVERFGSGYDCWWFACSYDSERTTALGLAFQAEAVWTPARFLGLGLSAFGNLNPNMSYAGFALGLHLGRVRR